MCILCKGGVQITVKGVHFFKKECDANVFRLVSASTNMK